MTRRRKKRTGASLLALILCLGVPLAGWAEQKPEPAVIAGTVFRDPGFALPGAEVELLLVSPPPGRRKPRPLSTRTDSRGEFSFQVPPDEAEYRVTARARGFAPETKTVRLSGGPERVDVYLTLKPVGSVER